MSIARRFLASLLLIMGSSTKDESYATALSMSGGLASKTVVVGLNAAFQKRFVLSPSDHLTPGSVHRAARVEEGLGGKGQDVAVALSQLWPLSDRRPLSLAQFVGTGPGGDAVMSLLSDTLGSSGDKGAGWDALTVRCRSPMRTCTTIVGSDASTELVEPSGTIEDDEMDGLIGRIDTLAAVDAAKPNDADGASTPGKSGAAALCIMGSMPPGCPDDTYANLLSSVAGEKTLTLVDSVIGLKALLGAMSSKRAEFRESFEGGTVLKVNAAELCRLAGVERSGGGEAEGATRDELSEAVGGFLAAYCDGTGGDALDYMAITDGRHPAHLVEVGRRGGSRRVFRMDVVGLTGEGGVLYPIGAGDTVAAGTLAAWLNLREDGEMHSPIPKETREAMLKWGEGVLIEDGDKELRNILTAFAFGLACGSASCLQQENSVFDLDDALKLFNQMSKPSP